MPKNEFMISYTRIVYIEQFEMANKAKSFYEQLGITTRRHYLGIPTLDTIFDTAQKKTFLHRIRGEAIICISNSLRMGNSRFRLMNIQCSTILSLSH